MTKTRKDDSDLEDELDRMVARLWGLQAAVEGAASGAGDWNGVMQLIGDVTEKMEKVAADFEAVRKVRNKDMVFWNRLAEGSRERQ